jgi:hypothetical protein
MKRTLLLTACLSASTVMALGLEKAAAPHENAASEHSKRACFKKVASARSIDALDEAAATAALTDEQKAFYAAQRNIWPVSKKVFAAAVEGKMSPPPTDVTSGK